MNENFEKIIRITPKITTVTLDIPDITKKKLTPIIQESEICTDDFINNFNQMFHTINNEPFILPNKCKFVKRFESTNHYSQMVFVIEEEPTVRTIRVNLPMVAPLERLRTEGKIEKYGYSNFELKPLGTPYLFTLSFPYVIHLLQLFLNQEGQPNIDHYLFYKLSPLQSTFDNLIRPNLPNIDQHFRVCAGEYQINETTIPGIISQYLIHFWSSVFNKDYLYHYISYEKDEIITDFLQWQYHSKQNPKCIFNVEWQPIGTLNKYFQVVEHSEGLEEKKIDLYNLYNLAAGSKITFKKIKPKVCFTNWIDSIWIEKYLISIGDKLQLKKKAFYVKDFIKEINNGSQFIVVEDEKGNIIQLKDTQKLRDFLLKEYQKSSKEFELVIDGEVYKAGEFVIVTVGSRQQYSVIESFSKSKTGKTLVILNSGHKYFVENIKLQKFNKFCVNINGMTFETNKKYLFLEKTPNMLSIYRERTFKEATIDYSEIRLDFEFEYRLGTNRAHQLYASDLNRQIIIPIDSPEILQVSSIFSFSNIFVSDIPFLSFKGNLFSKDNTNPVAASYFQIKQYVNENEITFPGLKPFKVGDHVAIALWKEPLEMIKRRVITKIIMDDEKEQVLIETNDGTNTRQDPIVSKNHIKYLSFSHITSEFGELKSGMVFKPKFAGVSCFPKKNNYRIIGFLKTSFTEIPMVLMSNCCTLWPFQLIEDFQEAPNENVENPTIEKIKFQDLDMYSSQYSDEDGFETSILLYNHNYAGLRSYNVQHFRVSGGNSVTTNPLPSSRIGFIYPRRNQFGPNIVKNGLITGTYNLYFHLDPSVGRFRFTFDRRLFENV